VQTTHQSNAASRAHGILVHDHHADAICITARTLTLELSEGVAHRARAIRNITPAFKRLPERCRRDRVLIDYQDAGLLAHALARTLGR